MAYTCRLKFVSSLIFIFHFLFAHGQPVDTLPVVVHVIHTGGAIGTPFNPTDSQIQAMLTLANNAFQKNGPSYGGVQIPIRLELANRSPGCGTTTGINRINGSSVAKYVNGGITTDTSFYPTSAHEVFVKGLSQWSNSDYLNIWVVNMIDGDPNGTAGYAYFPGYVSSLLDGVVIRASAVNGTNKVLVHELGHYFSLAHTFGNAWSQCEVETDCTTQGDQICDTENCMFTFSCAGGVNPCSGNNYLIEDPQFGYTVLNNYMGYTDCQWMFTADQHDVIVDAIDFYRPGLISSLARKSGTGNTPAMACMPTAVNGLSIYYGLERLEFGTLDVFSGSSSLDGNFYIDRSCLQQATVHAGDVVPVSITSSYGNFSHIKLFLDYNGNGFFDLPNELILSGDASVLSGNVTMPLTQNLFCIPLRLRVVTDHPAAPPPTACMLTGTPAEGVGQIEDYAVIIKPRQVSSISSGNWNTPSAWSCNCIPSANDGIVINAGHIITVPLSLGTVFCAQVSIKPGGQLKAIGNVHVVGGGCF